MPALLQLPKFFFFGLAFPLLSPQIPTPLLFLPPNGPGHLAMSSPITSHQKTACAFFFRYLGAPHPTSFFILFFLIFFFSGPPCSVAINVFFWSLVPLSRFFFPLPSRLEKNFSYVCQLQVSFPTSAPIPQTPPGLWPQVHTLLVDKLFHPPSLL